MRRLLLSILVAFDLLAVRAQKAPIDPANDPAWEQVENAQISNNGKYALYTVNVPGGKDILVLKSSNGGWERTVAGARNATFTSDNQHVVYLTGVDSLCLLSLGGLNMEVIQPVNSFRVSQIRGESWLAYGLKGALHGVVAYDLTNGMKRTFAGGLRYNLIGAELFLQCQRNDGKALLEVADLTKGNVDTIWTGSRIGSIAYPKAGNAIAFTEDDPLDGGKSIWYYVGGMKKAQMVVDSKSIQKDSFAINNLVNFDLVGKRLFFDVSQGQTRIQEKKGPVSVNIWNYKDARLQSDQLLHLNEEQVRVYLWALDLKTHVVTRLEREHERILPKMNFEKQRENYVLLYSFKDADLSEWNWNQNALVSVYLFSVSDGTRRLLRKDIPILMAKTYSLSPSDKYVIYYDAKKKNYFSYCLATDKYKNLTEYIRRDWTDSTQGEYPMSIYLPAGSVRWTADDKRVLITDGYDIFSVDPAGESVPDDLTNGYGHRHKIKFGFITDPRQPVDLNKDLVLTAFNRDNKEDGFYRSTVSSVKEDPIWLNMAPAIYVGSDNDARFQGMLPIKARDTSLYIIQKMSAEEGPNFYFTSDFIKFSPLSYVHPERAYNWLTSELIKWKTPDGKASDGILYKPENFDPKRKYPIIFYYYEKLSDGLNGFMRPELCRGQLNIPYYVSNGYLVFAPDIHYKIGYPGRSAFDAVVSAAMYLSKRSYVDAGHMGIQGHSFGGFETDYIVAHTKLFAAACSASGWADFISAYDDIRAMHGGVSRQVYYEEYRERIGTTLWQRPDLYMENSPILRADKIETPLLMMNNEKDADVSFTQGVEFFNALRRLHKRAWMLDYEDDGHLLSKMENRLDLNIRMKQFFDHYLKAAPGPKWMKEGIPAGLKGIDSGYEIDNNKAH